jgi:hypothetical protein
MRFAQQFSLHFRQSTFKNICHDFATLRLSLNRFSMTSSNAGLIVSAQNR